MHVCAGQDVSTDGVRGCPRAGPRKFPRARTYSGQRRRAERHTTSFTQVNSYVEGRQERPVKPSAQPTLVRTQHLPPVTTRSTSRSAQVIRNLAPATLPAGASGLQTARSTRATVHAPGSHSPSLVFPQLRSHLKRSSPRPGEGRIRPTHSPQDTADGLMNRSLSREKPVTQSSVTGFDLRRCVAGVGFEPT